MWEVTALPTAQQPQIWLLFVPTFGHTVSESGLWCVRAFSTFLLRRKIFFDILDREKFKKLSASQIRQTASPRKDLWQMLVTLFTTLFNRKRDSKQGLGP